MAGANGGWPAPPTLQVASNLLRSISPTASTIRWMMSSSSSHSIMSTGSRKRCRRSGVRKKWAIDPHLGSMAPRESRPPPQRHYLLMPRGHQFAVRYGSRLREEVLQALDLGALRLHHRFRAGQSRERLVAIPRGEQPHQVAAKATALAERTEQRVKLHRERLQRSRCRRTRLTGGHRRAPPMTSTHKRMPGLTNHR